MEEQWKNIKGFEGLYQISNLGNVRSLKYRKRNEIHNLKLCVSTNGYIYVNLKKDKKQHVVRVHRLVAEAFCDNSANKPHVNHLNNDRADNRATNLEWCTVSENLKYASIQGRMSNKESLEVLKNKNWINLKHARENAKKAGYPQGKAAREKLRKPVIAYDENNNVVARYESLSDVKKDSHDNTLVSECCRGIRKMHHKLYWKFAEKC